MAELTKLTTLILACKLTSLSSLQTLITALPALTTLGVTLALEEQLTYDFKWGAHMETLHIMSNNNNLTFNIPKNLRHFSLNDEDAIAFTEGNYIVNLEDLFTEKLISCKMWSTRVDSKSLEKLSACTNLEVIIKHFYFVFIFIRL